MADNAQHPILIDGREVKVNPLTDGQLAVLMRTQNEPEAKAWHHICLVVEAALGPDEWTRLYDGMARGEVSSANVGAIVSSLIDQRKALAAAATEDDPEEAELAMALAALRAKKRDVSDGV